MPSDFFTEQDILIDPIEVATIKKRLKDDAFNAIINRSVIFVKTSLKNAGYNVDKIFAMRNDDRDQTVLAFIDRKVTNQLLLSCHYNDMEIRAECQKDLDKINNTLRDVALGKIPIATLVQEDEYIKGANTEIVTLSSDTDRARNNEL